MNNDDAKYLALLSEPLEACLQYRPKFGQGGEGVSLEEFQTLYGSDPFYRWFGLNSPLMYAAHRTAGGMTSIYRQLGIGAERVFNQILQDSLGLTQEEAAWRYEVPSSTPDRARTLSLDGRIDVSHIRDSIAQERVRRWLEEALVQVSVPVDMRKRIKGVVFETRQGYKSKDSKRQNADIANASNAYVHGYIPCLLLFSNQLDTGLFERYTGARWLILKGATHGSTLDSAYLFCRDVLGCDLAAFFERNSAALQGIIEQSLRALLGT